MDLGQIAQYCYNLTTSYLRIENATSVISETQDAIKLTRRCFLDDIFPTWSPLNSEISFSYNGGKDCQALLLLYLSCIWEFFLLTLEHSLYDPKYHAFPLKELPTVFIDHEQTFSTLEEFVATSSKRYCLSLYESGRDNERDTSMADAFKKYLEVHPEMKAFVIGIRHTDPYAANLKAIQRTDANWPDFLRLQPFLHWKLANVWSFLIYSNEPICGLYGLGLTSIGSINNTLPNPHLKVDQDDKPNLMFQWEIEHAFSDSKDASGEAVNVSTVNAANLKLLNQPQDRYLPGWYLTDDSLERAGRIKKE